MPANKPPPSFIITSLLPADWDAARTILAEGIATGRATFETEPPPWELWDAAHLPVARLAARRTAPLPALLGWAALTPVSGRACYHGVAEVSLYVAADWRRRGVGSALLAALVCESEKADIWTLQAAIFTENEPSLHLYLTQGFRLVGRRERIAQLHGRWHDTVLLERRSTVAGQ